MIRVIENPKMPHLRFEYHPITAKVYWMVKPTPGATVEAFILAEHCPNDAAAFGLVQTFCRGYALGRTDAEAAQLVKKALV